MKKLVAGLTLLTLIGAGTRGARPEPENQPDPRTRSFPHIEFCNNYVGGTPRVLFVVNEGSAWEVYALALRMDLDYDVFYTGERSGLFAPTTDYYHEGIRLYPEAVQELRDLLSQEWDVLAFVDCSPYILPTELHYRVLEKVAGGTGAVCFSSNRWQIGFREPGILPLSLPDIFATAPRAALTLPQLQQSATPTFDQRGATLASAYDLTTQPYVFQPLAAYGVGRGRIIIWQPGGGNYFGGPAMHPAQQQDPAELLQSEYFYGLAAKLINLGANREPPVRIKQLDADGQVLSPGADWTVTGALTAAFSGQARVTVRTPRNELVHTATSGIDGTALSLALPGLPAGAYYVDVWLQLGEQTVDWASAQVTMRDAASQISDLAVADEIWTPASALRAVATISGPGQSVTARIRDAEDRILVEQPGVAIRDGKATIALPLARTRDSLHRLEVSLHAGGAVVDVRRADFVVVRPLANDLVAFTDADNRNLMGERRYRVCREYGINVVEVGRDASGGADARLALAMGMRPAFRIWQTHCYPYTGGCLSSPTYGADVRESFRQIAAHMMPLGLSFFSVGDDSGVAQDFCESKPNWMRSYALAMARKYKGDYKRFYEEHEIKGWGEFRYLAWHSKPADIQAIKPLPGELEVLRQCWQQNYPTVADFNRAHQTGFASFEAIAETDLPGFGYVSPCVLGFRDRMRQSYGDIDRLNAAWQTELADFDAITNPPIEAAVSEGKYGAKLDKTWYLEDLFIGNMKAAGNGVRDVSNEVGIGMGAASFGNIIPEVLAQIDSAMPYKGDRDLEIIRSTPHRFSGQTIGVYGGKRVPAAARENQAWETVFSGGNFIWFWSMITGGLMGDLSMNPGRSGVMLENIRELQGGIARALIQGERLHDGIAILHSRRAGALGRLLRPLGTVESSQVGFQRIIEDFGLQYRYTWTTEVEGGVLRSGEFKVLILPYTQILSVQEVAEIRAFVAAGGCLIADFRCATHDWHGQPLAVGALDDLFGIRQDCRNAQPVKGSLSLADAAVPGIRSDGSVTLVDVAATATVGQTPVVMQRRHGDGQTVFLNQSPTTYQKLLNRGAVAPLRQLYAGLLAAAGVKPKFRVELPTGEAVAGAEIAVFRNGPIQYLTIEKNAYQFEQYPLAARLKLDQAYYVFNTRTGQAFGHTDTVPLQLTGLGCYVFTLLPYQSTLRADGPAAVAPGSDALLRLRLESDGTPGPHTLRVEVFRPDGSRLWPNYKLETTAGQAQVVLPIAANDPPGTWQITATDVTTGQQLTETMQVTK